MKQFLKFAHSVQGANHFRDGKVCQDASRAYENGWMSVIAVADGHGSSNYPRTDRGSKFAVKAAEEAIKEFVKVVRMERIDVYAEQEIRLHDLELNILRRWHEYADQDVKSDPFCERDLERVSEKYREIYYTENDPRHKKAYGTTLIAICVTEDYWFGLQIGDAKCFAIDWDGTCIEPIPWDENCQANITTSICDADAIDEFRFFCGKEFPLAVFIGSDGVDDSYAGDEELHDLYRTIFCLFAEKGTKIGISEIRNFLPTMSQKGSGDDVSMAGLIRAEVHTEMINLVRCQQKFKTAKRRIQRVNQEIAIAREKRDNIKDSVSEADIAERRRRFEMEYEKLLDTWREAQKDLTDAKCHLDAAKVAFQDGKLVSQKQISLVDAGKKRNKSKRIRKKKN